VVRSLLALCLVFVVAASGCAFGFRASPTEITANSAVLNGNVLSGTGGEGSYYFEFGELGADPHKVAVRPIDFEAGKVQAVSEPVDGLEYGTIYSYRVCAEDSQNAGSPVCLRPLQVFPTAGQGLRVSQDCDLYPPYYLPTARVVAPPNTEFQLTADGPGDEGGVDTYNTGPGGFQSISFLTRAPGLWTFTLELPDETLTASISVDCAVDS
jgi:hypothetical protein